VIEEVHALVGAYAVDAISARERGLFEDHLPDCPTCAQETRELAATVALLGAAAWAPAPPQLHTRVIARIAETRQDGSLRGFRTAGRAGAAMRRAALAGAACLALIGVGLGGYAAHLHSDLTGLQDRDRQAVALSTAPDARTMSTTAGGITGTVTLSRHSGQMMFLARGLDHLPTGRTYQIWLSGPDGLRSVGTFRPAGERPDAVLLAGPGTAQRLMVTDEPAPGSVRPTTAPLLQLDLPPT
jgi:hypothetical protein